MQKPVPRLGKGLSALLATPAHRPTTDLPPHTHGTRYVPVDQIHPNPRQPRATFGEATLADLAGSIRDRGLLQPVLLRTRSGGGFELIAGERRWRAAQLAGLREIPAVVREASDAESLELALVENLQREDLAPLERAAAYQQYLDSFGGSADDLAARLGESRSNVANYLRLLKLQPEVCFLLGSGELSMGHARALAAIADEQRQLALARLAARRRLSVRAVEALAREPEQRPEAVRAATRRVHAEHTSEQLSKALGMPVSLIPGKKKNSGRVVIHFSSLEEFDRIAERLTGRTGLE